MSSAEELKAQGNAAFGAGRFAEAAEHFSAAIAVDPSNQVLYSNRSAAHASQGQYGAALEDAKKTVELEPDWPKGYSRLGAAHFGLRQWDDAAAAYSKGLELDPSNAQLRQGLQDAKAAAAPRPAPASSTYAPPPPSGGAPDYGTRAGSLGQLVLLGAHLVMILSAVLTVQPLDKRLSWQAYFLFCRTALVASFYKVYLRFGLPPLRPFPAALQPWLQQAAVSTEFFHALLAPLMMQSPQMWVGVVPLAVLAAYPALDALRARAGAHPLWARYGGPAQAALQANKASVLRFCASMEITLGFSMALGALSGGGLRGAMLAYVYWNSLRIRYWAPESRPYHQLAWQAMGQRVQPLLNRVPALQRYMDYPVRWFQAAGQQAAP